MSRLPEQEAAADSGHVLTGSAVDDCSPINLTGAMEVGRGLLSRPERRVQQGLTALPARGQGSPLRCPGIGGGRVRGEAGAGFWGCRGEGRGQERQLLSLKGDGKEGLEFEEL